MRCFRLAFVLLAGTVFAVAAAKPHVVSFGAPIQVKVPAGSAEDKTLDVTIHALYVDTRLKEYTTGARHDVTDRLFVIQRAFRINDALPDDPKKHPKWFWQRGGWLLVDRSSGKVSALKLADFDPYHSEVSWYRDYAAYCGVPENGDGVYALVTQIGIHKPLFRKSLGKSDGDAPSAADCAAPHWERSPARVTFSPGKGQKFTVNVAGRLFDVAVDSSPDEQ